MHPSILGCDFTYDVFLCAHDELHHWIKECILTPLESDYNPPYKVCWHLRDFIAGLPTNEQIENAVYESRKVALIFSEHFMESELCRMEYSHAVYRQFKTKTRCLLPIVLDNGAVPMEVKSMQLTCLEVAKNHKYLTTQMAQLLGE